MNTIRESLTQRSSIRLLKICIMMVAVTSALFSQVTQMVIDGSIRIDGAVPVPPVIIRIMAADSSMVKTVTSYNETNGAFGVSLFSNDGFSNGSVILVRVILSADSFIARTVNGYLRYQGTAAPYPPPIVSAAFFRNHAPVVNAFPADTSFDEMTAMKIQLAASDEDNDPLQYLLLKGPAGLSLSGLGEIAWTPAEHQGPENDTVVFAVQDPYGGSISKSIFIQVREVNRSPVMETLKDTVFRENSPDNFKVSATDPDIPANKLSYSISAGAATGMSINDSTGIFTWKPGYDQAGIYPITIRVTDNGIPPLYSERSMTITVRNVNRPPQFTSSLPDTTIAENQLLTFQYTVSDLDLDTIHYTLTTPIRGMTLSSLGLLSWKPDFLQAGTYSIIVSVSDGTSSLMDAALITVQNVNRLPSAMNLGYPGNSDTVRLYTQHPPILFQWDNSVDPDVDDTIRYSFWMKGSGLDTLFADLSDSSLHLDIMQKLAVSSKYIWSVSVTDGHETVASPDTFNFFTSSDITRIERERPIPAEFVVEQNFPNPFNPSTRIRYALPAKSMVRITVYNSIGKQIGGFNSVLLDAGWHETVWGGNYSTGIYFYRIEAVESDRPSVQRAEVRKMLLVK